MSAEARKALIRARNAVDAALVALDLAELHRSGEAPVPIKTAADMFGVSDKSMQRYASKGGGVKIRNQWHVYLSRIVMPACPQVSADSVLQCPPTRADNAERA